MKQFVTFSWVFLLVMGSAKAQTSCRCESEESQQKWEEMLKQEQSNDSGVSRQEEKIQILITQLRTQGYLLANLDSLTDSSCRVFLGKRYAFGKIELQAQRKFNLLPRWEGLWISPVTVDSVIQYLSQECAKEGYLDPLIELKPLAEENNNIHLRIILDEGVPTTLHKVKLEGDVNVDSTFLLAFLQLKIGQPFQFQRMENSMRRLQQFPWIEQTQPPSAQLDQHRATLRVPLKARKTNSLEGILGFLPNEEEQGKTTLAGEVHLELHNLLRTGKYVRLDWQRFRLQSQQTDFVYRHPAFFNLPLELEGRFQLFRRDTSFFSRDIFVMMSWYTNSWLKTVLYGQFDQHAVLSRNAQANDSLVLGSSRWNAYGAYFSFLQLDDALFPTRGFRGFFKLGTGIKRIEPLDEEVLTEENKEMVQWESLYSLNYFLPLRRNMVLLLQSNGGIRESKRLFFNELIRFGGLHSLRGFNENSFFARYFQSFTAEYRILSSNNDFFAVFYDQGVYEGLRRSGAFWDFPSAVGLGAQLGVGQARAQLYYALGRSQDQPFDFAFSRLHIGFLGQF